MVFVCLSALSLIASLCEQSDYYCVARRFLSAAKSLERVLNQSHLRWIGDVFDVERLCRAAYNRALDAFGQIKLICFC